MNKCMFNHTYIYTYEFVKKGKKNKNKELIIP